MIISTSNAAKSAVITANPEPLIGNIGVISDGDYSSKFTATLTGSITVNFKLNSPQLIEYIAIYGNVSTKDSLTINLKGERDLFDCNGQQLSDSNGHYLKCLDLKEVSSEDLKKDECRVMVIKVDSITTDEIEVIIRGNGKLDITEIAFGKAYKVPHGEQAGYERPWATPSTKARSSNGLDSMPVNFYYCNRERSVTLTVPNNLMSDYEAENGWRNMLKFTSRNTFYVLEDENMYHGYAGFVPRGMSTKAHSQTRLLCISQFTFIFF